MYAKVLISGKFGYDCFFQCHKNWVKQSSVGLDAAPQTPAQMGQDGCVGIWDILASFLKEVATCCPSLYTVFGYAMFLSV